MGVLRISTLMAAAALGTAMFAAAPSAYADIQYTNFQVAYDVNVTISCTGIAGCNNGYYGSGQINLYNNSATPVAQIWCIDVTHDLQGPWSGSPGSTTYSFAVTNFANVGGGMSNFWTGGVANVGTQLSVQTVGELGALAEYGNVNLGATNPNLSSAVQLAIWTVEYSGVPGETLTLTSDSTAVQSLAATLVFDVEHGAFGSDLDVAWLTCANMDKSACNQGQLLVTGSGNSEDPFCTSQGCNPIMVPEPASLGLLGVGLLGFGGMVAGRRRRKAATPQA
ncbi:MAG TPA: PEP-CTERM sorting domain-containing protein [Rhizomicrobium sp.]|jgi:hypothetical protein